MADRDLVADLLVAGRRGRAVCLAISGLRPLNFLTSLGAGGKDAKADDDEVGWLSNDDISYDHAASEAFTEALAAVFMDDLPLDDGSLTDAVDGAVGDAMYWQEPGSDDRLLADPRVC